jgi:hypothetical protein
LLIEDVTLTRSKEWLTAQVRFKGGTAETIAVGAPRRMWDVLRTNPDVIRLIDEWLNEFTTQEIVERLNTQGLKSGSGQPFTPSRVRMLCWMYSLRSRRERLKAAGYRTAAELAKELGVSLGTVKIWRRRGLLQAIAGTDRGDWYFKPLGADRPKKQQGCKLSERIQTVPVKSSKRGAT